MNKSLARVSNSDTLLSKIKDNLIFIIIYALILLFILWPIIAVVFNSIYVDGKFTLDAYSDLTFKSTKLLYNSFIVAFSSATIAVVISTIIAIYVTLTKGHLKKFIMVILLVSMISPPYVDSLSFIILFGKRGLITHKLLGLNINPYGFMGIVIMETLAHIPRATLFTIMAMESIDKNIIHASRDLGSDELSLLRSIILPMSKHGMLSAFFISFVTSLSDFGTPIVIGGGFNVLATEAYLNITGVSNIPLASAMSIYLLIPSLVFFLIYRKQMAKDQVFSYQATNLLEQEEEDYLNLPNGIKYVIKLVTYFFMLVVVVKYLTIFSGSFISFNGGNVSFTLKYFDKIDSAKLSSFKRSIQYSFVSGIAGSVIGILLAYGINRNKIPGKNFIDFVATLPYMMPGTLFGIAYILAFKNPPLLLIGTSAIVILNCIFKQIPISSKAGAQALSKINPDIENAAKDCGASNFHLLKDIVLPLLTPAFITSFINIFSSTMVTIGALIFLVSPGKDVATVQLFSAIKEGNLGVGCILANMIILTTIFVNLSMSTLLKGKFRRGEADVYRD